MILGLSTNNRGVATIFIGVIKVIFTFISLISVDRIGRRSLLLIGSIGLAISLMILSIIFNNNQSVKNNELNGNQIIIALISLGVAVASYSLGFGPVTWLVVSELFPDEIRGRGNKICISPRVLPLISSGNNSETTNQVTGPKPKE